MEIYWFGIEAYINLFLFDKYDFIHFLIYELFDDAVIDKDYTDRASNLRMANEW
jgi:hypothetical protein